MVTNEGAYRGPGAPHEAGGPDPAALAGLRADSTRAAFCLALLDGRAWTAGEPAGHAGVAASTATEHLNLLTAGGLRAEERRGRHRCVRPAGAVGGGLCEPAFASGWVRRIGGGRAVAVTGSGRQALETEPGITGRAAGGCPGAGAEKSGRQRSFHRHGREITGYHEAGRSSDRRISRTTTRPPGHREDRPHGRRRRTEGAP